MNFKKTFLSGLAAVVLGSGCAYAQTQSRIEGEVTLGYVPKRIDDIPRKNEFHAGTRLDFILPVKRSSFFGGVNVDAYGPLGNPFVGLDANKFIGEIHAGYRIGGFEFFISHYSAHPLTGQEMNVYTYIDTAMVSETQGPNTIKYPQPRLVVDWYKPNNNRPYTRYLIGDYDYKTEIGVRIKFSGKIGHEED